MACAPAPAAAVLPSHHGCTYGVDDGGGDDINGKEGMALQQYNNHACVVVRSEPHAFTLLTDECWAVVLLSCERSGRYGPSRTNSFICFFVLSHLKNE